MGDSSDEDMNSDDEVIDLSPLWRDPPFVEEPETEDPVNPDFAGIDDGSPPRVIELSPILPNSVEDTIDPLTNLMNEINDMSRRVTNARIARQRIMDLGRPVVYGARPVEDDAFASSSNQIVWSTNAGPSRYYDDPVNPLIEDEQIPYRYNQFRHMVAGGTSQIPVIPPRWARGRQTFSMLSQRVVGRMVDSSTQDEQDINFVNAPESGPRFVLPAAIEERERACEIDEGTRAERAWFVSELVLASMTQDRSESPPRAVSPPKNNSPVSENQSPDKNICSQNNSPPNEETNAEGTDKDKGDSKPSGSGPSKKDIAEGSSEYAGVDLEKNALPDPKPSSEKE